MHLKYQKIEVFKGAVELTSALEFTISSLESEF